jgi:hypothetical protein
MLHVPPPAMQRCLSASSAQLKAVVIKGEEREVGGGEEGEGGMQVAMVK